MDTGVKVPRFWENDLCSIERAARGAQRGAARVLSRSQGGRDIHLIEYGEKQDFKRKANYNSACSYKDPRVYADKAGAKPVILLVGASHGGEIEGVTALLNLIHELETGADLLGRSHAWLARAAERFRLLIIPCHNPDGRARVPFSITTQATPYEIVYYKHGLWKDGTLAEYNVGFRAHPIIDEVTHMGGYYNDAGVNPCVDNFFSPMSVENIGLMQLVDQEAPDVTLLLHTGCHKHGKLIQPTYMPGYMLDNVLEFDEILRARFEGEGCGYYSLQEHGVVYTDRIKYPSPRFDMSSAIHHACGGMCVVYESYEATHEEDDPYCLRNILDCHFMLFEETLGYALKARGTA